MGSEAIRMALQTVFGFASVWLGRYSPTLQKAINFGLFLTQPDVWARVWGIYQEKQTTPGALPGGNLVNNHDPFAYLEQHAISSDNWEAYRKMQIDAVDKLNPKQTSIQPGGAPAPTERLPDTSDDDEVTAGDGTSGMTEEPKAKPARKGTRGRPDGE